MEAMQATIDDETAAQLDRDRARYGVARGRAVSSWQGRTMSEQMADSPAIVFWHELYGWPMRRDLGWQLAVARWAGGKR